MKNNNRFKAFEVTQCLIYSSPSENGYAKRSPSSGGGSRTLVLSHRSANAYPETTGPSWDDLDAHRPHPALAAAGLQARILIGCGGGSGDQAGGATEALAVATASPACKCAEGALGKR